MPFTVRHNAFNGAEISLNRAPTEQDIAQLIQQQSELGKALLWVTVPILHSKLIPLFTEHNFVFHNCNETELTLIHRIQPSAYAPFVPTHTIGVAGLVENTKGEVLLVRDKWMKGKGLKLPGGYLDLGESVHDAATREVYEETGIQATFEGILGLVTKHPHAYGKSNYYIVCKLTPKTESINIQDVDEIEHAAWVAPEAFVADDTSSTFHRHLVDSLRGNPLLEQDPFEFIADESDKHMYRAFRKN